MSKQRYVTCSRRKIIINNLELLEEFRELLSNAYIHLLFIMVLFDIATGTLKEFVYKEANSTKGSLGGVKHLLMVMFVLVAYPYKKGR